MSSLAPSAASHNSESARTLRAQLLSHFQQSQNSDGGWPFHMQGDSRVEPTCWALRALAGSPEFAQSSITRGIAFLKSQQLADGSWPAATGMSSGGWVTSLAASVLAPFVAQFPAHEKSVHAALQWLCDDYPRDSSRWQKFLKSFSSSKHEAHNDEFRGWGWTPRTSSWVEPTAFALMAFDSISQSTGDPGTGSVPGFRSEIPKSLSSRAPGSHSKPGSGSGEVSAGAPGSPGVSPDCADEPGFRSTLPRSLAVKLEERRALAIGLLHDRMCAGGGWNCGNPRVYGVDGDSLVLPTCWALLALRGAPEHPNRQLSLAWLQKSFASIASPGSLSLAQIVLEAYGVPLTAAQRHLTDWSADDLTSQGTHIAAWTSLALNPSRRWPASLEVPQ